MKGKPGDENYFKNNVSNIWVGKLDKFNDEGNAHDNFNYSLIQNQINIDEISKISIEINLPSPNYNLYILEKTLDIQCPEFLFPAFPTKLKTATLTRGASGGGAV